jgi:N-terminal acetyltransferase B complex non-catalytic subunit
MSLAYHDISDNVAKNVFPQVDPKDTAGPLPYIMPNAVPNVNWFIESHDMWDASSRYLYKEGPLMEHFDAWAERAGIPHHTQVAEANMSQAELQVQPIWESINAVVEELACQKDHEDMMPAILKELKESIHEMRKAMEKLRMPGSTALKPEDEPTMFHENMLLSCYTKLEVLRALNKLVEHLREKVVNAKTSHSLKSKLPKNWVNEVESETKICYASIRDVADSYIKLIKTTGEAAIKAQVKWGKTGASLQKLLKDDDIDFYASEYADSALHAWKGVLEVKLK